MKMKTKTNSNHSRFNAEHYQTCVTCYEEHLDFEDEQAMDIQADNDDRETE